MTTSGRAYVVRSADAGTGPEAVTQVYPYTLKGLTTALDDARFRSYGGTPQVLAVVTDGKSKVIRRFEHGHEVPVTPLPPPLMRVPAAGSAARDDGTCDAGTCDAGTCDAGTCDAGTCDAGTYI